MDYSPADLSASHRNHLQGEEGGTVEGGAMKKRAMKRVEMKVGCGGLEILTLCVAHLYAKECFTEHS